MTRIRVTLLTCHVEPRDIVTCHVVTGHVGQAGAPGGDDGGDVRLEDVDPGGGGGLGGQGGHGGGGGARHTPLALHRDVRDGGVMGHALLVTCRDILVTTLSLPLSAIALIHAGLTDTACNSKNVIYDDKTSRNFELKYSKRQF